MSPAADEIFPSGRRHGFVQTEWAEGWAYAVIGFGEAARMLTEQRQDMRAGVDQIGLAVFYLQRHRVELVIKQALVALGQDSVAVASLGHALEKLWQRLGQIVRADDPPGWTELDGRYSDFVDAIHRADQGSFAYRYPIDRQGKESQRAPFIDLEALERHARDFDYGVSGYTDYRDELRRERDAYNSP